MLMILRRSRTSKKDLNKQKPTYPSKNKLSRYFMSCAKTSLSRLYPVGLNSILSGLGYLLVHCQWKMIADNINPKPVSYSWFPFLLGPQVIYPRCLEGAGKLASVVALIRTRTDIHSAIPQICDFRLQVYLPHQAIRPTT